MLNVCETIMKRLDLACVMIFSFLPSQILAECATLSWEHDCQDSPPTSPTETASGFGGFNLYESSSANGPFNMVLTIPGCIKRAGINIEPASTKWFRVTAVDRMGNESSPASVSGTLGNNDPRSPCPIENLQILPLGQL